MAGRYFSAQNNLPERRPGGGSFIALLACSLYKPPRKEGFLMRFLGDIPHETVRTLRGETVELFRLGTTDLGTFEMACLYPGTYAPHIHDGTGSLIHVASGTGIVEIDGQCRGYKPGDTFFVSLGASHGFEVKTDTVLFTRLDRPIKNPESNALDLRYADGTDA